MFEERFTYMCMYTKLRSCILRFLPALAFVGVYLITLFGD